MPAHSFDELMKHFGHDVHVTHYGTSPEIAQDVVVECKTCKEVLLAFERSEMDPHMGWFRDEAKKSFHDEGTIEIDDNARVNCVDGNEGAYVQAWVWVDAPEEEDKS